MGEIQGVINLNVERFRPGRFANVDHFAVVSFHGGGDAHECREPLADRGPALRYSPLAQLEANGVQHMIGQDSRA